MTNRLDELKVQLKQLDDLARSGALPPDQAAAAKAKLERELVDLVTQQPAATATPAPAAASAAPAEPAARPSRGLLAALAVFVLAFGIGGYAWLGTPAGWNAGPGSGAQQASGGQGEGQSHATDRAQFESMTAKLAERLQQKPDDANGWAMLGRSYAVLGRLPESEKAFKRALDLKPNDAQALADYADALAMVNGRNLEGEPEKYIARAVKADGNNVKALSLAGTVSFQRGQFAEAARQWEVALRNAEPGSEMAQQIQSGIDEARQRAGLPPTPGAGQGAASDAPLLPVPQAGAAVKGRVTLAAALKAKASPDDSVFIFARPASGSKMPLAILRKQVRDLPLDFTLDDSMAMSPAARLSSAQLVVVGARVSKSGNAMPQPGDLQGFSAEVKPGTDGIKIDITEEVR